MGSHATTYGEVNSEAQLASEFMTPEGPLFEQPLAEPRMKREGETPDKAEYTVGVNWKVTVDPAQAKRFKGVFANKNIVCKLRDAATVDFLIEEFGVQRAAEE